MNEKAAKDAIKKIAKREGKSEIREEMKKAIRCGYLNNETRCKEVAKPREIYRSFIFGGCKKIKLGIKE